MDDFSRELYRELYRETLGYKEREARCLESQMASPSAVDQSRFLVSRVHLKRVAYFFSTATVVAVLFAGGLVGKTHRDLSEWNSRVARNTLRQVSYTKDLEIAFGRVRMLTQEYLNQELTKDRSRTLAKINENYQLINDRVSSLEFLFKGTTAVTPLNEFQSSLANWKSQTQQDFDYLERGNAEAALEQWNERGDAMAVELGQRALELSALAEDYARREQLALQELGAQHSQLLWSTWVMLMFLVVGSAWVLTNFMGAIGEFLTWFRRQSWELLGHSDRLNASVAVSSDDEVRSEAKNIQRDVHVLRSALKSLLEVFSGNINGERQDFTQSTPPFQDLVKKAAEILKFENGSQKMRELLSDSTKSQEISDKAVGE